MEQSFGPPAGAIVPVRDFMEPVSILIRNGTVIDGTGKPGFRADVAINRGVIADIGDLDGLQAERTIDASSHVVCPGFIDMHAHADLALLREPAHAPKIMQGVTTEVFSNCGLGFAPATPAALQRQRDLISALFGDTSNIHWDWRTVGEFMSHFERGTGVNIAYLIPHGTLRVSAMGMEARTPSAQELDIMKSMLFEGMQDGAFGLSTGLWYAPMCYAPVEEPIELCRIVARFGGIFAIHLRDYADRPLDHIQEALEITRKSAVSLQLSHYLVAGKNKGLSGEYLRLLDSTVASGLNVDCDSYPYTASSTLLQAVLPQWAATGGAAAILDRLAVQSSRARIIEDMARSGVDWDVAFFSSVTSDRNRGLEGRNFADVARERGISEPELVTAVLLEEELHVTFRSHSGHEQDVRTIMQHPRHMVGSDGLHVAGKPHPRLYGTFPRYLGKYAREEKVLTLETVVKKMTSQPALKLGLKDRGTLEKSKAADIVVFNPDTVIDTATFEDPMSFPIGIPYVLVNGIIVKDDGRETGALPGRVLRR
jgi:N-acyl-D-amino-acid deacylase